MKSNESLFQDAFDGLETPSDFGALTQGNIKALYPEIFIKNTSKSRRARLASTKVSKTIVKVFDEQAYQNSAKFYSDALIRYRYSSKFYRVCRKLAATVFKKIFLNNEAMGKDIQTILASELFDSEWYRNQYGIDGSPSDIAKHYLLDGYTRLNDPSPHFSTKAYLEANSDVATSPINPLVHYLNHGFQEKRKIVQALGGVSRNA
ncbi:hypothetical protein DXV75_06100 [Alteromonas aestuariivivens]|uniref:Uncharacterized protein n=1 Tax=Alteromonas aestuariivivens TaxID=1938339 RepID=A0A3D8M9U6_9ALTE|nr:hypothetical protein [Alteromonas aestuariivivens]RDV26565.1 hypothetical protein DXV75_06100 [Alteromonas aestuariivivens]